MIRQIKRGAVRALKGNWGRAAAACLVMAGVVILFAFVENLLYLSMGLAGYVDIAGTPDYFLDDVVNTGWAAVAITGGTAILTIFILAPLRMGILRWYYRLAGGGAEEISGIFSAFSSLGMFGRSLLIHLSLAVRMTLWGLVFFLPLSLYLGIFSTLPTEPSPLMETLVNLGLLFTFLLLIAIAVFYFIFIQRYFFALYLLAEDPKMSVRQAIRESIRLSKGRKGETAGLCASFWGWFLLGVFLLPLLFAMPYFETSASIYARFVMESDRRGREAPPAEPVEEATREFTMDGVRDEPPEAF